MCENFFVRLGWAKKRKTCLTPEHPGFLLFKEKPHVVKSHFNNPQGSTKGILAAAYSLGAIISLPIVPIANNRLGRRWAIMVGSLIGCVGAIIQCFSVNSMRESSSAD